MIPRPNAETEAGLRPIRRFPCVYRVWMAIRKSQCKEWSLRLYESRHAGAAALAARTTTPLEVRRYWGTTACWYSSNAARATSGWGALWPAIERYTRGWRRGSPKWSWPCTGGDRHLKAHGAVVRPRTGGHGLVAGCALAKGILEAFLAPIKEGRPRGKPRDYVDDVA